MSPCAPDMHSTQRVVTLHSGAREIHATHCALAEARSSDTSALQRTLRTSWKAQSLSSSMGGSSITISNSWLYPIQSVVHMLCWPGQTWSRSSKGSSALEFTPRTASPPHMGDLSHAKKWHLKRRVENSSEKSELPSSSLGCMGI